MPSNLRNIFILQAIALLFATLNLSNIKIEYVADFLPLFDVMIIYYFTVFRPQIFGTGFLFLMGIIADSINGVPLGATSLCYILLVKLFCSLNQRMNAQENFHQIFWQFSAFIVGILLLKWLILSLYYLKIYNIFGSIVQMFITCVIYILMHRFFDFLDKKLVENK